MIDAWNITRYDRTDAELQAFALFSVAVAGKSAATTDAAFERLWVEWMGRNYNPNCYMPFALIRTIDNNSDHGLAQELKKAGFGCFNNRAKSFRALIDSHICLRTCSAQELEQLYGWGPKTSRFFLLHSRAGFQGAPLDTHVLKFLRDSGISNAPKSTPPKGKRYNDLETKYMALCPPWQTLAEFDLEIWKRYAKRPRESTGA